MDSNLINKYGKKINNAFVATERYTYYNDILKDDKLATQYALYDAARYEQINLRKPISLNNLDFLDPKKTKITETDLDNMIFGYDKESALVEAKKRIQNFNYNKKVALITDNTNKDEFNNAFGFVNSIDKNLATKLNEQQKILIAKSMANNKVNIKDYKYDENAFKKEKDFVEKNINTNTLKTYVDPNLDDEIRRLNQQPLVPLKYYMKKDGSLGVRYEEEKETFWDYIGLGENKIDMTDSKVSAILKLNPKLKESYNNLVFGKNNSEASRVNHNALKKLFISQYEKEFDKNVLNEQIAKEYVNGLGNKLKKYSNSTYIEKVATNLIDGAYSGLIVGTPLGTISKQNLGINPDYNDLNIYNSLKKDIKIDKENELDNKDEKNISDGLDNTMLKIFNGFAQSTVFMMTTLALPKIGKVSGRFGNILSGGAKGIMMGSPTGIKNTIQNPFMRSEAPLKDKILQGAYDSVVSPATEFISEELFGSWALKGSNMFLNPMKKLFNISINISQELVEEEISNMMQDLMVNKKDKYVSLVGQLFQDKKDYETQIITLGSTIMTLGLFGGINSVNNFLMKKGFDYESSKSILDYYLSIKNKVDPVIISKLGEINIPNEITKSYNNTKGILSLIFQKMNVDNTNIDDTISSIKEEIIKGNNVKSNQTVELLDILSNNSEYLNKSYNEIINSVVEDFKTSANLKEDEYVNNYVLISLLKNNNPEEFINKNKNTFSQDVLDKIIPLSNKIKEYINQENFNLFKDYYLEINRLQNSISEKEQSIITYKGESKRKKKSKEKLRKEVETQIANEKIELENINKILENKIELNKKESNYFVDDNIVSKIINDNMDKFDTNMINMFILNDLKFSVDDILKMTGKKIKDEIKLKGVFNLDIASKAKMLHYIAENETNEEIKNKVINVLKYFDIYNDTNIVGYKKNKGKKENINSSNYNFKETNIKTFLGNYYNLIPKEKIDDFHNYLNNIIKEIENDIEPDFSKLTSFGIDEKNIDEIVNNIKTKVEIRKKKYQRKTTTANTNVRSRNKNNKNVNGSDFDDNYDPKKDKENNKEISKSFKLNTITYEEYQKLVEVFPKLKPYLDNVTEEKYKNKHKINISDDNYYNNDTNMLFDMLLGYNFSLTNFVDLQGAIYNLHLVGSEYVKQIEKYHKNIPEQVKKYITAIMDISINGKINNRTFYEIFVNGLPKYQNLIDEMLDKANGNIDEYYEYVKKLYNELLKDVDIKEVEKYINSTKGIRNKDVTLKTIDEILYHEPTYGLIIMYKYLINKIKENGDNIDNIIVNKSLNDVPNREDVEKEVTKSKDESLSEEDINRMKELDELDSDIPDSITQEVVNGDKNSVYNDNDFRNTVKEMFVELSKDKYPVLSIIKFIKEFKEAELKTVFEELRNLIWTDFRNINSDNHINENYIKSIALYIYMKKRKYWNDFNKYTDEKGIEHEMFLFFENEEDVYDNQYKNRFKTMSVTLFEPDTFILVDDKNLRKAYDELEFFAARVAYAIINNKSIKDIGMDYIYPDVLYGLSTIKNIYKQNLTVLSEFLNNNDIKYIEDYLNNVFDNILITNYINKDDYIVLYNAYNENNAEKTNKILNEILYKNVINPKGFNLIDYFNIKEFINNIFKIEIPQYSDLLESFNKRSDFLFRRINSLINSFLDKSIKINYMSLTENIKGYYDRVKKEIVINRDKSAGVKEETTLHEKIHAILDGAYSLEVDKDFKNIITYFAQLKHTLDNYLDKNDKEIDNLTIEDIQKLFTPFLIDNAKNLLNYYDNDESTRKNLIKVIKSIFSLDSDISSLIKLTGLSDEHFTNLQKIKTSIVNDMTSYETRELFYQELLANSLANQNFIKFISLFKSTGKIKNNYNFFTEISILIKNMFRNIISKNNPKLYEATKLVDTEILMDDLLIILSNSIENKPSLTDEINDNKILTSSLDLPDNKGTIDLDNIIDIAEQSNGTYDYNNKNTMQNSTQLNLWLKTVASLNGYDDIDYKNFVKKVSIEDFIKMFYENENDTVETKDFKEKLRDVIFKNTNIDGITDFNATKDMIVENSIINIYNRLNSAVEIRTISINIPDKTKNDVNMPEGFDADDFTNEFIDNNIKKEVVNVVENGNQNLVNGKYVNSWFSELPIMDYAKKIGEAFGVDIEVQLLSDINGSKIHDLDMVNGTYKLNEVCQELIRTNRFFLLPYSDKSTSPVFKLKNKEQMIKFLDLLLEYRDKYRSIFLFDNIAEDKIKKMLGENSPSVNKIFEMYHAQKFNDIIKLAGKEIFDELQKIDSEFKFLQINNEQLNLTLSMVLRYITEELKYGNNTVLDINNFNYSTLKNKHAAKIFKRHSPVVSKWKIKLNKYLLSKVSNLFNDSIRYDEETNEIYFRTAIIAGEGSTDSRLIDSMGHFRFDGCTYQTPNAKEVQRVLNGTLNYGAMKNFIVHSNMFFKHSVQMLYSEQPGSLYEQMEKNNIAFLSFNSNEKLSDKKNNNRTDSEGKLILDSVVIGYDMNNNPVDLSSYKTNSIDDLYNGNLETFEIPLSSIYRIGETHSNKIKSNGAQQSIFSSGICAANKAISNKTIKLLNKLVTNVAKNFNDDLLNKNEDYPDYNNMQIEFGKFAQKIVRNPKVYQHIVFSGLFSNIDKMTPAEAFNEVAKMIKNESVMEIMRDYLGDRLLDTVKLNHKGTMSVIMPDLGNLAVDRIVSDENIGRYISSRNDKSSYIEEINNYKQKIFKERYRSLKNGIKSENITKYQKRISEIEALIDEKFGTQGVSIIKENMYDENGYLKLGYCHITSDIADRLGLSIGDEIIVAIVPTDSGMGFVSVKIANVIDEYLADSNGISFSSEFIMLVGKDFDIDKITILRHDEKILSKDEWHELCEELKKNWDNYKSNIRELLGVKTDKEAFNEKRYIQLLQSLFDATTNKPYISAADPKAKYLIASYKKDVGYVIMLRQLHQLLGGIELIIKNDNGKDYNVNDKDLWFLNHVVHLILTNFEVDYPNTMAKDFINYDEEKLYQLMFRDLSGKKLNKLLEDIKIFNDFLNIPRFSDGDKGYTRVQATFGRIVNSDNIVKRFLSLNNDYSAKNPDGYYLSTLVDNMQDSVNNLPIPYTLRPAFYSHRTKRVTYNTFANNIYKYSSIIRDKESLIGLESQLLLSKWSDTPELALSNPEMEKYNIEKQRYLSSATFQLLWNRAIIMTKLYVNKFGNFDKIGIGTLLDSYKSKDRLKSPQSKYVIHYHVNESNLENLKSMSIKQLRNIDYFLIDNLDKNLKFASKVYNVLYERLNLPNNFIEEHILPKLYDYIYTLRVTGQYFCVTDVFVDDPTNKDFIKNYGAYGNISSYNELIRNANAFGKKIEIGNNYKAKKVMNTLLTIWKSQTANVNKSERNEDLLPYMLSTWYQKFCETTDYIYGQSIKRPESTIYNLFVYGTQGSMNYSNYKYRNNRYVRYDDLDSFNIDKNDVINKFPTNTIAMDIIANKFTETVLATNNYKIFESNSLFFNKALINDINSTNNKKIDSSYYIYLNKETNTIDLMKTVNKENYLVKSVTNINDDFIIKSFFEDFDTYTTNNLEKFWNSFKFNTNFNIDQQTKLSTTVESVNLFIKGTKLDKNQINFKEIFYFLSLTSNIPIPGQGIAYKLLNNYSNPLFYYSNIFDPSFNQEYKDNFSTQNDRYYSNLDLPENDIKNFNESLDEAEETNNWDKPIQEIQNLIDSFNDDLPQLYDLHKDFVDNINLDLTYNKKAILKSFYRDLSLMKKRWLDPNREKYNKTKAKVLGFMHNKFEFIISMLEDKIYSSITPYDNLVSLKFDSKKYLNLDDNSKTNSKEVIYSKILTNPIPENELGARLHGNPTVFTAKAEMLETELNNVKSNILSMLSFREFEHKDFNNRTDFINYHSNISNFLDNLENNVFSIDYTLDDKYMFRIDGATIFTEIENISTDVIKKDGEVNKSVVSRVKELIQPFFTIPDNIDIDRLISSIIRTKIVYHAMFPKLIRQINNFAKINYNELIEDKNYNNIVIDQMESILYKIKQMDDLFQSNTYEYRMEEESKKKKRFTPIVIHKEQYINYKLRESELDENDNRTKEEVVKSAFRDIRSSNWFIPSLQGKKLEYLNSLSIKDNNRDVIFTNRIFNTIHDLLLDIYRLQYETISMNYNEKLSAREFMRNLFDKSSDAMKEIIPTNEFNIDDEVVFYYNDYDGDTVTVKTARGSITDIDETSIEVYNEGEIKRYKKEDLFAYTNTAAIEDLQPQYGYVVIVKDKVNMDKIFRNFARYYGTSILGLGYLVRSAAMNFIGSNTQTFMEFGKNMFGASDLVKKINGGSDLIEFKELSKAFSEISNVAGSMNDVINYINDSAAVADSLPISNSMKNSISALWKIVKQGKKTDNYFQSLYDLAYEHKNIVTTIYDKFNEMNEMPKYSKNSFYEKDIKPLINEAEVIKEKINNFSNKIVDISLTDNENEILSNIIENKLYGTDLNISSGTAMKMLIKLLDHSFFQINYKIMHKADVAARHRAFSTAVNVSIDTIKNPTYLALFCTSVNNRTQVVYNHISNKLSTRKGIGKLLNMLNSYSSGMLENIRKIIGEANYQIMMYGFTLRGMKFYDIKDGKVAEYKSGEPITKQNKNTNVKRTIFRYLYINHVLWNLGTALYGTQFLVNPVLFPFFSMTSLLIKSLNDTPDDDPESQDWLFALTNFTSLFTGVFGNFPITFFQSLQKGDFAGMLPRNIKIIYDIITPKKGKKSKKPNSWLETLRLANHLTGLISPIKFGYLPTTGEQLAMDVVGNLFVPFYNELNKTKFRGKKIKYNSDNENKF